MMTPRARWATTLAAAAAAAAAVMIVAGCSAEPHPAPRTQTPDAVVTGLEETVRSVAATAAVINHTAPDTDYFGTQWCGATLTTPTTLVTAAHCVKGRRPGSLDVVIGVDNLCSTAPRKGERLQIAAVRVLTDKRLDLAILTTTRPSRTPPVATAGITEPAADTGLFAVGWGRSTGNGPAPCRKQVVALQAGDSGKCRSAANANPQRWHPSQLCATATPGSDRNTCVGDSGGPLYRVSDQPRRIELLAVTTWGVGCKPDQAGFYSPAAAATNAQ